LTVTLDGRDSSYLEWVGAVSPSLARPGGAMHEVAASPVIASVLVGVSESGLCLRLAGDRLVPLVTDTSATLAATLAIVIGGADVRTLPIDEVWQAVDEVVEVEVPFDQLGPARADLEFSIQLRDRSGSLLESVPHGRFWTIRIPDPGESISDWPV